MWEREWLVVILLIVSGATHLVGLGNPREVVFDEVHFGKFVTAYCCTGERFFDIHPPHAKLLIAAAAKLSGYRGGFSFEHIGQPYGSVSPIGFRVVPALAGTLLPVIIYILLRQLGGSRPAAFFGGLVVVFDNALTIQTRIMALDGVLLVSTFGALAAYLAAERADQSGAPARRWVGWAALAGALGGVAVGTKFTGLLALGLPGILGLYRLVTSRSLFHARRWLAMEAILFASAAAIYIAGWVLHFVLLTQPGSGDAWGVPEWRGPVVLSFWRETIELHQTMYRANNGLTIFHHDSSPWWGWPFMNTPVFYWHRFAPGASAAVGAIYFIGNPVVWIGSTLLGVAALAWVALVGVGKKTLAPLQQTWLLIPVLGYSLAFLPLTRVDRGLFLYHYLSPLLFAIMLGVLWLDQQGWLYRSSIRHQPRRVYLTVAALFLFFLMFSPLTYGWLLNPDTQKLLFWFSSWR